MSRRVLILKSSKELEQSESFLLKNLITPHMKSGVDLISFFDLTFIFEDNRQEITTPDGRSIADYDLVYLRDIQNCEHERNTCALFLKQMGVKYINSDAGSFQHISKLSQYSALSFAGVSIPSTIFGKLSVVEDQIAKEFEFPFIAKEITGKNGAENYLIKSADELDSIRQVLEEGKFVFQEFIENDRDYRVIIINKEAVGVYERKRPSNSKMHVNNAAAGGSVTELAEIESDIASIAEKAAHVIGREIAGVDVMKSIDGSRMLVLEVNANYAVEGFMKPESPDVKKLAEYFDSNA